MAEAYFGFDTNARQVANEIDQAMRDVAESLNLAARGVGGRVPVDIGDQIVRNVQDGVARARREMATLFSDVNIAQFRSGGGTVGGFSREGLTQVATNAFNQIRLGVDQALQRLDPAARFELTRSGELSNILDSARMQVLGRLEDDFTNIRDNLSAQSRRGLRRVPDLGAAVSEIAGISDRIMDAEHERLTKMFAVVKDIETGEVLTDERGRSVFAGPTGKPLKKGEQPTVVSEAAYVAAEQQSLKAESAERAARTKERLQAEKDGIAENKRLAQEGAAQLGAQIRQFYGEQDAIWRALRVFSHPETGAPVRRTPGGAEEIIHDVDMARLQSEYTAAVRDIENLRRYGTGEISRVGASKYYQGEEGQFFQPSSVGTGDYRMQGLRQIDPLREELDYINARNAVKKEQARVESEVTKQEQSLLREAQQQIAIAERDDAQLRRQQDRQARHRPGFIGGIQTGIFGSGFGDTEGVELSREQLAHNIGRTAGSALRYSAAYGGLYELAFAAQQALEEFSDFQDSLTDYEVAVGGAQNVSQGLTGDLMELTRVLGENVGAAYDAAARGVRAFADAQATAAEKTEIGRAAAEASQQMAVITGKSQVDATGDLVSIGTSFGLSAFQAETVIPDAIASAKKLGGDPAQIAQGLSNFATTAEEAGLSIEEAANMISLVQARTDQSGQAVATRLSRMFSILGGTTGRSLISTINRTFGEEIVDAEKEPADQLRGIADAYVQAGVEGRTSLQGLIRSQLGGTSNVRELIPLLEEMPRLQEALRNQMPGAGLSEYERKISKFINQIDRIRGSFKNLVVLAAEADLAAPFAAAVYSIEPMMHMLERLLQMYTRVKDFVTAPMGPAGDVGSAVGTTAALGVLGHSAYRRLAGSRLAGEVAGTSGVTGAVARSAGVAPVSGLLAADAAALGAHSAAVTADTAAQGRQAVVVTGSQATFARLAVSSNGAAAAIGRMGFAASTWVAGMSAFTRGLLAAGVAIGAVVAADKTLADRARAGGLQGDANRLLADMGGTPEQLRYSARALQSSATNSTKGFSALGGVPIIMSPALWGEFTGGFSNNPLRSPKSLAREQQAETSGLARTVDAIRAQVAAEDRRLQALRRTTVFGETAAATTESLAVAMGELAELGYGPQGQLRAFRRAWMEPPRPAILSADRPVALGAQASTELLGSLRQQMANLGTRWINPLKNESWKGFGPDPMVRAGRMFDELDLSGAEVKQFNTAVTERLQQAARDGVINDDELTNALNVAADTLDLSDLEAYSLNVRDIKNKMVRQARAQINKIITNDAGDLRMRAPTAAELETARAAMDANLAGADPSDPRSPLRRARENYRIMRQRYNAIDPSTARQEGVENLSGVFAVRAMVAGGPLQSILNWDRTMGGARRDARVQVGADIKAARTEMDRREHAWREQLVARATALREAEEATLDPSKRRNWAALAQIRRRGARREFAGAGGDITLIKQIMDGLDRETIMAVIAAQRTHVAVARVALDSTRRMVKSAAEIIAAGIAGVSAAFGGIAALTGNLDVSGALAGAMSGRQERQFTRAKKRLNAMEEALKLSTPSLLSPAREAEESEKEAEKGAEKEARDRLSKAQLAALKAGATIAPDDTVAMAKNAIDKARADMAAAATKDEYWNAVRALTDAQDQYAKAVAGRASAFAAAEAARGGGQISAARAQLEGVVAQMDATTKGTEAYANLLAQYYQNQQALTDAILNHKFVLDQLSGDMTDPLEQARDAVRDARRRLNAHQAAGMDDDVIAQDRLTLEQRQNERQRTAFDQRMSDAQTANELGRMSFQAYMNYLDREHDRLSSIKHRTRQQQDMLDQVDQAIKSAMDSMDSQFNLGSIDVNGLVYQTRRFMAEQRGGFLGSNVPDIDTPYGMPRRPRVPDLDPPYGRPGKGSRGQRPQQVMQQDVRINIDGADIGTVRRVLSDILGPRATQTRTVMNRKVG